VQLKERLESLPGQRRRPNGAFVLASVWLYQSCYLHDYRAGKPLAHVKEQMDCVRWRIKT
jgi:hypothetical protein